MRSDKQKRSREWDKIVFMTVMLITMTLISVFMIDEQSFKQSVQFGLAVVGALHFIELLEGKKEDE